MKYTIIAIVVVLAIVIAFIISTLKKSQYQKIVMSLQLKDRKEFNELLNNKLTKFLFPAIFLDNLRLSDAIMRDNKGEVSKLLEKITKQKLSSKDKERVYSQAYNYYLSINDKGNCTEWYNKIQNLSNDRLRLEVDKTYNIYVEKGYKYLDEMLEQVEEMDPKNAGVNEFLISLMYQNKGDAVNAKKYKKLSEEHLKALDEEIKAKQK